MKALKILYFVRGAAPSPAQLAEAHSLNANVCFRNALAISNEAALEACDGVSGDVPPVYSAKFPAAEAALEARAKSIAALSAKVGDEPAPKKGDDGPTAAAMTKPADAPAKAGKAAPAAATAPTPPAPAAPAAPAAAATGWKPNA
ncbi:hypothetical protein RCTITAN_12 [Rhodobacter phage RcTitan]|uniref:Uncharacterized protein n=1 Tax=Rhodobacter phage RcTitan TaxID=1662330 RepID=A0A0K1LKS7_9CAUD|nr:hypothetical protein RCTITAN_12 [Rhodobacter phage RcTitan]AKU43029.1 hypothetical protein RCTITAN_12 [Rhodobacter phage RcTitan]